VDFGTIADLVRGGADDPFTTGVTIFLASLLAEDATAVLVGLLVSRAILAPVPALGALLAGTIFGDIMLHLAGRYASDSRWGRATLQRSAVCRAIARLDQSAIGMVALARFVPGMRLPVYFGSGFLKLDFIRCLAMIMLTGCLWTPALFWTSVTGGAIAAQLDGDILRPFALVVALCLIAVWIMRTSGPTSLREGDLP